ncbi:helicase associated domain-containing protein [Streptomyces cellulosae]|uniref:Helicase associated domain-containing protein n=1 Tax=Streptomyces cellulosae TaxID=1968 RepID=A0ABW7YI34_STRCE
MRVRRCPPRRAKSCARARTSGGGCSRCGSGGTSSRPSSSGCANRSSGSHPRPRTRSRRRAARRPTSGAMNYEAAKQFYEREGRLQVPRKHIERIVGEDQEEREHRLGAWIGNQRSRAATLTPERVEQLSAIGMRWA